ncbi:hypothetical protein [Acidihalobacter ferrooxydans]|uniref:Uncharacterized protein n=1 Tax=Acidihalobacter ferrooxydans TaxID=1765967 RepID=A0A1P8UD09_9GAMM|nr:hypothetical protein [Acidihalobacter ferrooxydans]APZ41742.1 hypothetical protein BW247_00360 [Acidihalobacter ferrooxydans]
MPTLNASLNAWDTAAFADTLCAELRALGAARLPLQAGMRHGGYVLDDIRGVMLLGAAATPGAIEATVGVFFAGIIAGCNCADDPTPVEAREEYCELRVHILRTNGEAQFTLSDA